MKKAKIVASIVLAAALGTTMFAAACGKKEEDPPVTDEGKEFVISEYAHSLNSPYAEENFTDYSNTPYVKKEYSSMSQLRYEDFRYDYNGSSDFAIAKVAAKDDDSQPTWTLYNVKTESKLFEGYNEIKRISGSFEYFRLKKVTDEKTVYTYVGPDGKLLPLKSFTNDDILSGDSHLSVSTMQAYKDKENNTLYFYSVTYKVAVLDEDDEPTGETKNVVTYFRKKVDKDGDFTFAEVTKDEAEADPESLFPAGSVLAPEKEVLADKDSYPNSNWKGIEVLVQGGVSKTYTFYKNDAVLSSVVAYNPEFVGYVGNYMYYYEKEAVSSDAKEGYNYEFNYYGTVYKANYTLYRFDFVKGGEPVEVETQYIVTETEATLFNTAHDSFDKLAVVAVKKENGVAVRNDESKQYLLVLDDEFKVSVDLSAKNITDTEIIKLQSGTYLVGNLIVNDNLDTVAKIPGQYSRISVWEDKNLLVCKSNSGYTMLIDYYGRVVIEPVYGSLTFYGDVAFNGYNHKIYSGQYASGVKLEKVVKPNEAENETVDFVNGVIVKTAQYRETWNYNDQELGRDYYFLSFYSPLGTFLGSIDRVTTLNTLRYTEVGGKLIVDVSVFSEAEGYSANTTWWIIK